MGDAISLWFNAGSTSLSEVNEARAWIERGCVLMAARNRRESDIEAIRTAVEAVEAHGLEIDDMLELDIDFHVAVSRAARNAVMELAMNAIHLVRPYTNTMLVPLLRIPASRDLRGDSRRRRRGRRRRLRHPYGAPGRRARTGAGRPTTRRRPDRGAVQRGSPADRADPSARARRRVAAGDRPARCGMIFSSPPRGATR
jgi:FCD domain